MSANYAGDTGVIKGIQYIYYQPFIAEHDGHEWLIQIFTDTDTGLIKSVQMAKRVDRWDTWGPPINFEKA